MCRNRGIQYFLRYVIKLLIYVSYKKKIHEIQLKLRSKNKITSEKFKYISKTKDFITIHH